MCCCKPRCHVCGRKEGRHASTCTRDVLYAQQQQLQAYQQHPEDKYKAPPTPTTPATPRNAAKDLYAQLNGLRPLASHASLPQPHYTPSISSTSSSSSCSSRSTRCASCGRKDPRHKRNCAAAVAQRAHAEAQQAHANAQAVADRAQAEADRARAHADAVAAQAQAQVQAQAQAARSQHGAQRGAHGNMVQDQSAEVMRRVSDEQALFPARPVPAAAGAGAGVGEIEGEEAPPPAYSEGARTPLTSGSEDGKRW